AVIYDAEILGKDRRDRADVGHIEKSQHTHLARSDGPQAYRINSRRTHPGRRDFHALIRRQIVVRIERGRVVELRAQLGHPILIDDELRVDAEQVERSSAYGFGVDWNRLSFR